MKELKPLRLADDRRIDFVAARRPDNTDIISQSRLVPLTPVLALKDGCITTAAPPSLLPAKPLAARGGGLYPEKNLKLRWPEMMKASGRRLDCLRGV